MCTDIHCVNNSIKDIAFVKDGMWTVVVDKICRANKLRIDSNGRRIDHWDQFRHNYSTTTFTFTITNRNKALSEY